MNSSGKIRETVIGRCSYGYEELLNYFGSNCKRICSFYSIAKGAKVLDNHPFMITTSLILDMKPPYSDNEDEYQRKLKYCRKYGLYHDNNSGSEICNNPSVVMSMMFLLPQ